MQGTTLQVKYKHERWSTLSSVRDGSCMDALPEAQKWGKTTGMEGLAVVAGGTRHAGRFDPTADVERSIVKIAGLDWQEKAQDRG